MATFRCRKCERIWLISVIFLAYPSVHGSLSPVRVARSRRQSSGSPYFPTLFHVGSGGSSFWPRIGSALPWPAVTASARGSPWKWMKEGHSILLSFLFSLYNFMGSIWWIQQLLRGPVHILQKSLLFFKVFRGNHILVFKLVLEWLLVIAWGSDTCGKVWLSSIACIYPPWRTTSSHRANSLLLPEDSSTTLATLELEWFTWDQMR